MIGGIWESEGYGWVLEFRAAGFRLLHKTALNGIEGEIGSHEDFARGWDRVHVQDDTLTLHQAGDLTLYRFHRIDSLAGVPVFAPGGNRDAEVNFDSLWQQFREHYAFFGLHRVDWEASRWRLRSRVQPGMSEDALFGLFTELLQPLDDGHVSLSGEGRHHQRMRRMDLRAALQRALGTPTGRIAPRSTVEALAAQMERLLLAPYDATRTPLRRACNDLLSWCELAPGIGYLSVLRLFGFADTAAARRADDLPRPRVALAAFLRDDLAALERALDAVFTELRHCRALIVDLRFNGGGFDRAGLAIAGRLADKRRVAFSKRAVIPGRGFTAEQAMQVLPGEKPFTAPVVALISPLCVSAGEILALALRALPQVHVAGEATAGMLSDNLIKPLPNGWELSLSNEIYSASDGQEFEGRGVPADVALPVLDVSQFAPVLQHSLQSAVALVEH